jgi:hypothetical protein
MDGGEEPSQLESLPIQASAHVKPLVLQISSFKVTHRL